MKLYFAGGYNPPENETEEYFYVRSCGCNIDAEQKLCIKRKEKSSFRVIYIQNGELEFKINEQGYFFPAESVIFYPPGQTQYYKITGKSKTSYYWLSFSGYACKEIIKDLQLTENVYTETIQTGFLETFKNLIYATQNNFSKTRINSIAIELLSKISPKNGASPLGNIENRMYFDIENHITDADYSKLAGLSKFYFIKIFKKHYGLSPNAYIDKIRLEKSKFLLKETDMKIKDIAKETNFCDEFYFSKFFKKSVGTSPTAYRNRFKRP